MFSTLHYLVDFFFNLSLILLTHSIIHFKPNILIDNLLIFIFFNHKKEFINKMVHWYPIHIYLIMNKSSFKKTRRILQSTKLQHLYNIYAKLTSESTLIITRTHLSVVSYYKHSISKKYIHHYTLYRAKKEET